MLFILDKGVWMELIQAQLVMELNKGAMSVMKARTNVKKNVVVGGVQMRVNPFSAHQERMFLLKICSFEVINCAKSKQDLRNKVSTDGSCAILSPALFLTPLVTTHAFLNLHLLQFHRI